MLCAATVEERVPPWMRNSGQGWVTAEYGMLPRSTGDRTRPRGGARQAVRPHPGNPAADRPLLRAVVDLEALGERNIRSTAT